MHVQCVVVATTLLHRGAEFHSFLYNGSKTVRVNTLWTGDADVSLHNNCARRMTQICVFNTRLVSTHYTLNYAINGAFLRMVLLMDIYRN